LLKNLYCETNYRIKYTTTRKNYSGRGRNKVVDECWTTQQMQIVQEFLVLAVLQNTLCPSSDKPRSWEGIEQGKVRKEILLW
jgi:hypothetical protein